MLYNISDGIFIGRLGLGYDPGVGLPVHGGGGQKFIFSKIQPNLVCKLLS